MSTPSLLLVPARLKDGTLFSQIPTNGSGDFTVVQAVGNATRVNASGLVESAKTNLALQSENFGTTWTSVSGGTGLIPVITANAVVAPDGTTTAETIVFDRNAVSGTANFSQIQQVVNLATSGTYTLSVYAKATAAGDVGKQFYIRAKNNLVSGTLTSSWVRYTSTETGVAAGNTTVMIGNRGGFTADQSVSVDLWGAQLEEGSSASDYIPTTTVARTKFSGVTVNGTSIANVPRLDYLASGGTVGCPGLLVEPSATNGLLNSADTTTNWGIGTSLTSNAINVIGVPGNNLTVAVSGSGIGVSAGRIQRANNFALVSGSTYTISFFIKKTGTHTIGGYYALITGAASGDLGSGFDVSGSFSSGSIYNSAGTTNRIRRVEQWGTDVYRCSETFTMTASGTLATFNIGPVSSVTLSINPAVGQQLGFAAPQVELGSVPTSFIPTTTGTVTRNADVISASGNVSGSIGQTEGSIYAEVNIQKLLGTTQRAFVDIGQAGNRLFLGYGNGLTNQIRFLLQTSGGGLVDFQSATTTTGTIRIAVGYKNSDSAMYVNGVKASPVSNGSFTASLSGLTQLSIGSSFSVGETHYLNDRINAVALYATRLSDDALMLLSIQGNDAYLPQAIWNFYVNSRTGNTEVPTCLYERHADIIDV